MRIKVKIAGELKHLFNRDEIVFEFENGAPVLLKQVLARVIEFEGHAKDASRMILASSNKDLENIVEKDLNPAIIILINDFDYRILDGLDSNLKSNDCIVILPSIHGG